MRLIDADALENELTASDRDIYVHEWLNEMPTIAFIPENATNGEVLRALFPSTPDEVATNIDKDNLYFEVTKEWWNKPYNI